jgi:hypothetical protein
MKSALNVVAGIPLGGDLINEISNSGKTVTIFKANAAYANAGPTTLKKVMSAQEDIDKMVKAYRPIAQNILNALKKQTSAIPTGAPAPVAPAVPGLPNPPNPYGSELTVILNRASKSLSRKQIAVLIGVDDAKLKGFEAGTEEIDNNTYARIGMVLYEFLTPGPGIDTVIRFAPANDVPDSMTIGHELIHAWRMMKGLRLFQNGWEEEAMTTGFPPFANFKFTENKLRVQARMELRTKYDNPVVNSLFMQNSYASACGIGKNLTDG